MSHQIKNNYGLFLFLIFILFSCRNQNTGSKQSFAKHSAENPSQPKNDKTLTLPFDSQHYYKTCVYPGDKNLCKEKYPRYPLSDTQLLSIVTKTFEKEPFEIFKIKHSNFDFYLVHFQGDDVDEYDLITLQNDKVIATLLVGISDESGIKDFVISDNKVDIFLRKDATGNSELIETYTILKTGVFEKLKE